MSHDGTTKLDRRHALTLLGSLGVLAVAGCSTDVSGSGGAGGSSPGSGGTSTTGGTGGSGTAGCTMIPDETSGPYPDKIGMLEDATYARRDITEGKAGLPLTMTFTVVDVASGCAPVANAKVEVWHCDAEGHYSEYGQPGYDGTGTTFLRGVQTTDAKGQVEFSTIYPGWYSGRATHVHVEVFVDDRSIKTTQMAFPAAVSAAVYRTAHDSAHGQNPMSNESDMVFSDGDDDELAAIAGDASNGYRSALLLGVSI